MASGPAAVTFSAPSALSTTVTFGTPGAYVLRFAASDSQLTSSADVTVVAQNSLGPQKTGGQYHLGPVDFAETQWHNACSPYPAALLSITGLGGELLAGVSHTYSGAGSVCDACIKITTATGRTQVARVVTYGDTPHPSNLDVSPSIYQSLNTGEYPRSMSWEFTPCPTASPLYYQFQAASSIWWTSLWVRNPKVPITRVEVKSANHASFVELRRETDGTLDDDGGFGPGPFTLRITGMDGQVLTERSRLIGRSARHGHGAVPVGPRLSYSSSCVDVVLELLDEGQAAHVLHAVEVDEPIEMVVSRAGRRGPGSPM